MWYIALREQRDEEETASDTIHADSKTPVVPIDKPVHGPLRFQPARRPSTPSVLNEKTPTDGIGPSAQQSEKPPPEPSLPRQDTDDSGVDVTPTRDLDDKVEYLSQEFQTEGDTLLHVYSPSPPRVELEYPRSREKARRKRIEAFQTLTEKREDVLGLRLKVHEARTSLRHDRDTVNDRYAHTVQGLRAAIASNTLTAQTLLLVDLEDLQKSRDSLHLKEYNYNSLEDQLNREEWELKEMELKLYERSNSAQISLLGDDATGLFEATFDETESSSSLSVRSGPREDSPENKRYLSRKGDANLLREQIAEMRAVKEQILEDKNVRKRIGLVLDEDSQNFLDTFDRQLAPLLEDLANVEEDVYRLHEALADRNVTFLSSQFDLETLDIPTQYAAQASLSDSPRMAAMETPKTELDALVRDPLLLPIEEQTHILFDQSDPSSPSNISTPGYINRWLLHRLRRSVPEVRRYKSAEELKKLTLDQEQIKDLVLEWWDRDESVADFRSARDAAALSLDLPLQTIPTHTYKAGARSESAVPIVQELLARPTSELSPATLIPTAAQLLESSNTLLLHDSPHMYAS